MLEIEYLKNNSYKEKHAYETVGQMRGAIEDLGFDVIEHICESGVGTYSHKLMLILDGQCVNFTYGKGSTPEFSLASAYGELLEEVQCAPSQIFKQFNYMYNKEELGLYDFVNYPDEKKITNREDYIDNDEYINYLKNTYPDEYTGQGIDSFIDSQYRTYGYVPMAKYIDANTNEDKYINELFIRKKLLGNTGLCAGNSKYEALLHGICEILERYVKQRLYTDKLCLPILPDEYLREHPRVYEVIRNICSTGRFNIEVRDASLGGKFPVVCVILYDKARRGYATSFGCFPSFDVAIDMAINELMQWTKVDDIEIIVEMDSYEVVRRIYGNNDLDGNGEDRFDILNLDSSDTTGAGMLPDEFLTERYDFENTLWGRTVNKTNEEMFYELCKTVEDETGDKVLYKDYTFLGVSAFSIICPKIAADRVYGLNGQYAINNYNMGRFEEAIYGSDYIDKEALLDIYETEVCYSNLDMVIGRPLKYKNLNENFYRAYMEFVKGNYIECASLIRIDLPKILVDDEKEFYNQLDNWRILVNYIGLMESIGDKEEIKKMLGKIYDPNLVRVVGEYCKDHHTLGKALFKDKYSLVCVVDWDMYDVSIKAHKIIRDKKIEYLQGC